MADAFQVDLTNCDREPIHIPGSIQPHGAMLVCDGDDFVVTYASANAAAFLQTANEVLTGRPLRESIGDSAAHTVRNAAAKSFSANAPGLMFNLALDAGRGHVDGSVHAYQGRTFVEFEPAGEGEDSYGPLELTRALVRRLADEPNVERLARSAARMVRLMLGYDRVMIYKLLHNGAGRVIAEERRFDLQSFLNQHFPASDIPAQARELYKRNWIRMIGDARYTPSPLTPALRPGEAPLDMSYAQLRSVSPIHCEYLQNMGVGASLSISIMVEGELWGLIACHHYSPKVVPLPQRVGAELFGQYFSLQVETLERRSRFEASQTARARLDKIVAELAPEEDLQDALAPRIGALAQLLPCDGAAAWVNGAWITHGATPPPEAVGPLVELLHERTSGDVWSTSQLSQLLPGAEAYSETATGALVVPLSRTPKDYLIYFRSEESRFVEWAGDPEKPIEAGPLGDRLTPRKSFELWRQEVRGQATPWTDADLAIADAAQNYLRDVVLRHSEATAEERKRAEVRRKLVNEELNHRVKNILALAKSIVEQSRAGADSVEAFGEAVNGRLRALSFAHDQVTGSAGGGDVRRLLEAELAAHSGVADRVRLDGPAVQLNARAYSSLALVVHELATNAAKYGALSAPGGQVTATWRIDADGACVIDWAEAGGPPVKAPTRAGFGSTLIGQVVPFDLGGRAEVEYAPAGLRAQFAIPQRHITAGDATRAVKSAANDGASVSLAGMRILLVEDQVLIALDAEHALRQLGAAQVAIAPTRERALAEIAAAPPDVAVLDVNLGDGSSAPVAEKLLELKAPFVFATGYGDTAMIPESMRGVPVVRKPYGEKDLAAALSTALGAAGRS